MVSMKKFLEKKGEMAISMDGLSEKFFEPFIMKRIQVDLLEPSRIVCSFKVTPHWLNGGNLLHGGATTTLVDLIGSATLLTVGTPIYGVSVEINVSFLDSAYPDEEVEVEAKALRVRKAVGVASVELKEEEDRQNYSLEPPYQVSCSR
ncbi:acyl-coenzyme A thioesterase 13 isoform X1 [Prunus yedoensis var. nudiflora]|uniref:Acyl-coenzyme A thioesterase 13 n=1 Tax=Prunus yedoensis var. nudiflora TaxID=2094558 RepID=A0A314Y644_PRUYE|nr:acyl-coenzyme A thioesterase 13 isoform X1 [Prunus yedoensis var. nudiflora]